MESWLCVPAAEDQEGDADQNRCEHYEDAGLDALECPEAAGRLEGHQGPVAVRGQARQDGLGVRVVLRRVRACGGKRPPVGVWPGFFERGGLAVRPDESARDWQI